MLTHSSFMRVFKPMYVVYIKQNRYLDTRTHTYVWMCIAKDKIIESMPVRECFICLHICFTENSERLFSVRNWNFHLNF